MDQLVMVNLIFEGDKGDTGNTLQENCSCDRTRTFGKHRSLLNCAE